MSDDRFLIIKDCKKSNGKWDALQELCHDYRVVFQRVLLLHNLGDDVIGIHLEFKDNEYDNFIKHVYDKKGSIYYPEILEWIPVTEDEWTDGIIPDREPIYKQGEVFDKFGYDWREEYIDLYRKKYKGFVIKNCKKYRESLDGKDLYVLTEDDVEEVDPIIVKFPYYSNK